MPLANCPALQDPKDHQARLLERTTAWVERFPHPYLLFRGETKGDKSKGMLSLKATVNIDAIWLCIYMCIYIYIYIYYIYYIYVLCSFMWICFQGCEACKAVLFLLYKWPLFKFISKHGECRFGNVRTWGKWMMRKKKSPEKSPLSCSGWE